MQSDESIRLTPEEIMFCHWHRHVPHPADERRALLHVRPASHATCRQPRHSRMCTQTASCRIWQAQRHAAQATRRTISVAHYSTTISARAPCQQPRAIGHATCHIRPQRARMRTQSFTCHIWQAIRRAREMTEIRGRFGAGSKNAHSYRAQRGMEGWSSGGVGTLSDIATAALRDCA